MDSKTITFIRDFLLTHQISSNAILPIFVYFWVLRYHFSLLWLIGDASIEFPTLFLPILITTLVIFTILHTN